MLRRLLNSLRPPAPLYWMEDLNNFGDHIGPWLIELMTGRKVRNVRTSSGSTGVGLMTVGSLIQKLDRPGMEIWGTGLIRPITKGLKEKLSPNKPAQIFAVRGPSTREQLEKKLGWRVPAVYGDPALLLPRYFTPKPQTGLPSVRVVPHYIHKGFFSHIEDDRLFTIDVQREPSVVVEEIASADCIVSSSLHGVICAHAYGVPWAWIRFPEHDLRGATFKFQDFFRVLDSDAVCSIVAAPSDITPDFLLSLAKRASLPRTLYDFRDLNDSLPL